MEDVKVSLEKRVKGSEKQITCAFTKYDHCYITHKADENVSKLEASAHYHEKKRCTPGFLTLYKIWRFLFVTVYFYCMPFGVIVYDYFNILYFKESTSFVV